jgi:hypothetical protein
MYENYLGKHLFYGQIKKKQTKKTLCHIGEHVYWLDTAV